MCEAIGFCICEPVGYIFITLLIRVTTLVEKRPYDAVKIKLTDAVLVRIRWDRSRLRKYPDALHDRIRFSLPDAVLQDHIRFWAQGI